jgi:alpha-L-rhamnosidase
LVLAAFLKTGEDSMALSRRIFIASASTLALTAEASPSGSSLRAEDLRTDYLVDPLGVETVAPSLSWRLSSSGSGARQTAYRITVASSADAAAAGAADLWDSGRVASADCLSIPYRGKPLVSRQRCFWRVAVWDEAGVASASAVACWEMGLLSSADWSGQWLAGEDAARQAETDKGFAWATAHEGKFRLVFDGTHGGEALLVAVASGAIAVFLDGQPFQTKPDDYRLLSGANLSPVIQATLPLTPGKHVLAIEAAAPGQMSAFLRLADGRRFQALDFKTGAASDAAWTGANFDDRSWTAPAPLADPPARLFTRQPPMLMRRDFVCGKEVRSARLYATALGAYAVEINGKKTTDSILNPASNDFTKHVPYRVFDVTALIRPGANAIGAMVADGWFASAAMGSGRYAWGAPPRRFLAQLELTFTDGSTQTIATGPDWTTAAGPVVSSEIYDGEHFDARLEQHGWSSPGFDAAAWLPARVVSAPAAQVVAEVAPPIRAETVLTAKSIKQVAPGIHIFDFGQNFAGLPRLKVKGPAGTRIELRFAEILKSDGFADQSNLRFARARDIYVLKGDPAGETYVPQFTYHGFRYVEMRGFPGTPSLGDLEALVVHSDLPFTGTLTIDNALIGQLWHNTIWSQRSNFMGIPTDCPQRDERFGWMGDANVFWDAAAFNMDVAAFTRSFARVMRDAQAKSGAFADFSPAPNRPSGEEAAPAWADAGICLPWTSWQRYGDTAIIDSHWEAMERYLAFIAAKNPDYIWRKARGADFGDWLALDAKEPGDPTTPKDLIGTAVWAHSVDCMAEMAEASGRRDAVKKYRAQWQAIAAAFVKAFITADGTIGNGSQTGYILALRYGLVPKALQTAAAAHLVADIQRRGTLLSTGFLGTPNSLDALAEAGYGRLVYDLLLRTDFPSWGYMVKHGATTIWERWNGDTGDVVMNSYNHYALGAVCGFVFRRIAGIAPLAAGFRRIAIRPVVDPRVPHAGARYVSAMGPITTDWRLEGGRFQLAVSIPANTSALVHLPVSPGAAIRESGRALPRPGVHLVRRSNSEAIVEIGAGSYDFVTG